MSALTAVRAAAQDAAFIPSFIPLTYYAAATLWRPRDCPPREVVPVSRGPIVSASLRWGAAPDGRGKRDEKPKFGLGTESRVLRLAFKEGVSRHSRRTIAHPRDRVVQHFIFTDHTGRPSLADGGES